MKKVILFASGEISQYDFVFSYLEKDSVVICCDGGMEHARKIGITPSYVLGDFDSVSRKTLDFFRDKKISFQKFPEKKDETDMELGLQFAVKELGAKEVVIFGGIGSRLDHTLANCHLLYYLLKNNVKGYLVNENNCVQLAEGTLKIKGKKGDLVSILPMGASLEGVTLKGLEYPLENFTIPLESPIGVSNVMLGEEAEIIIGKGIAYVIQSRDI